MLKGLYYYQSISFNIFRNDQFIIGGNIQKRRCFQLLNFQNNNIQILLSFELFMDSETYTTLLKTLQRPINCLTDQDRNIRKSGLTTLLQQLPKASKQNQIRILLNTNLCKNIIHTIDDPIQNNRQITLNIIEKLIIGADLKRQQSGHILTALIARINATPFPQKSEDLREKLLKLLKNCIIFKEGIILNMSQLCSALGKCLGDPSSSIKNYSCELINELCLNMKGTVGKYGGVLTKSLVQNLKHNKFQVRKTTLNTLAKLLITEGAGANFQYIQNGLKGTLADTKADVRKATFQCVGYLLKYMAPKYIKQYEANLVSYLLVGLSDQSIENINLCVLLLQQCGKSIKQIDNNGEEMIDEQK